MIRMGVIGAGRIGRLHAESIARRVANAELVSLCDVNEAAVNQLAAGLGLGVEAIYTNHNEMLAACELDAVAICSYSTVHAEQIVTTERLSLKRKRSARMTCCGQRSLQRPRPLRISTMTYACPAHHHESLVMMHLT